MRSVCVLAMLAIVASLLAGCDEPKGAIASTTLSDPEVGIVVVKAQARAIVRELPGRIAPMRVSEVRPQVSGIIVQRLFRQGSEVKAGDPLYRVDPRPFEVEVQAGEAALARAQAVHVQASQQAHRIALLTAQRTAPEAENEKAIAAERQAEADVEARKADIARAKLNLDYASIRAPIDGVVGAAQVTEGALVGQNDNAILATIQQLDPIYADFTQSVGELMRLRRDFETGELDRIAPDAIKVHLVLDDGTQYPLAGKLLFSETRVDANTGQVTLRGEFPNPNRDLLPGMYVRVQIEQGIDPDAIAVPQQAVQRNGSGGSEVFVVKDDNRIVVQPIRTGSVQDGEWFVTDGLKPGIALLSKVFRNSPPATRSGRRPWPRPERISRAGRASQPALVQR